MNAAKLDKSQRLQKVWSIIGKGGWWSTMQIIQNASVCAVNSIVSELRANGKKIECKRVGGAWYYRRER